MARRRRRRKSSQGIVINATSIGRWFIILGVLYFFAYFMAPTSPILARFHQASFYIFWEVGTLPFFGLSIIFWIMVLVREQYISILVKQFIISLLLISAILNFPILDEGDSSKFTEAWGYISRPIFYILEKAFWADNPMAIKGVIVTLTIWILVWIFYQFNIPVPVPRVNVRLPKQSKPARKKTKTNKKITYQGYKTQLETQQAKESQGGNLINSVFNSKKDHNLKAALQSTITKSIDDKVHQKTMAKISFPKDKPTFPLSLLHKDDWKLEIDHTLLAKKADLIQSKLIEFWVPVTIDGFDVGPSIIQIRVKPDPWIKISTIENLKQDIALATKSKALRIVAPIPWTDCVWIQIPNPSPRVVYLGDVLGSSQFTQSIQNSLMNITLWQAIDGSNLVKALDEMPHLLIAWATGSGKSVWVNDFILSLMYQNNPNELKFLMIDPKQVELEMYAGLPYLLAPIVTQADKALKLLQRAVEEMESRYTKLAKSRVKKLSEFNKKFPNDQLYRIVVVIDELADLMMSGNKKEVEACITRIAQKARAVWIHLIVATQRPSVNVITGLIKANIPTRIAFGVVSQIDSRTILGMKWAEDLLGRGDLLYMDPKTKFPLRAQAPYVDTNEIDKVITALKKKYMNWLGEEDIYHPEILRILENKVELASNQYDWDWEDEAIVQKAIELVLSTRKASATFLQRRLRLWFARAARIMDELEKRGVVWPQEWSKAREILM